VTTDAPGPESLFDFGAPPCEDHELLGDHSIIHNNLIMLTDGGVSRSDRDHAARDLRRYSEITQDTAEAAVIHGRLTAAQAAGMISSEDEDRVTQWACREALITGDAEHGYTLTPEGQQRLRESRPGDRP
jgi:hypothetical protein